MRFCIRDYKWQIVANFFFGVAENLILQRKVIRSPCGLKLHHFSLVNIDLRGLDICNNNKKYHEKRK